MEQDVDSVRCSQDDRSNAVTSQTESKQPFCRNGINDHVERARVSSKNFQNSIADASYGEESKRTTRKQEKMFDNVFSESETNALNREKYCHVGPTRDVEYPMNAEEVTDLKVPMQDIVRNLPNCDRLYSTEYGSRDVCFQEGRMAEFFGRMISLASFIDGGCSKPFSQVLRRFCADKQSSLAEAMRIKDETTINSPFCPVSYPTYGTSVLPEPVMADSILHEQSFRAVLRLKHGVRELARRYNISYT